MKPTAKKTQKEIKVLSINTLYEYAEKFYNYEKEHFSKFIGIDIFKVDGSIKQKYSHDRLYFKGQFEDGTHYDAMYHLEYKYNSLDICVRICVNGGSYDVQPVTAFCQYENQSLTLFNTEDNKLIETNKDIDFLKTRFTVEGLQEQANEINKIAEQYEQAAEKFSYVFKQVFDIKRLQR